MIKLEKFIKDGLSVGEIRRRTGVSQHVIKSEAITLLDKMGVKHYEYELLRLICTQKAILTENGRVCAAKNLADGENPLAGLAKSGAFDVLQKEIISKVAQGVGFEDLRKISGMSHSTLKSQLKSILIKLDVWDVEYTLLFALLRPKNGQTRI